MQGFSVNTAIAMRISSSRTAAALSLRALLARMLCCCAAKVGLLRGLARPARRAPLPPTCGTLTAKCPTFLEKSVAALEIRVAHFNGLSTTDLSKRGQQSLELLRVGAPIQAFGKLSDDSSALRHGTCHLQFLEDLAGGENTGGVKETLVVGSTFGMAHQSSPQPLDSSRLANAQFRCRLRGREWSGKELEHPIMCTAALCARGTGVGNYACD